MTSEFIHSTSNQAPTPTFNDLHNDLVSARLDYINRGGKSRLGLVEEATGPYVGALDEILDQLPFISALDRQHLETKARISSLGLEYAPTTGDTASKSIVSIIGASILGGAVAGATGSDLAGDAIVAAGFGYGLGVFFGDRDKRRNHKIDHLLANSNAVMNIIGHEKTTEEILDDENRTVIGALRESRKKEKLGFVSHATSIAVGTVVGRSLSR